MIPLGDGPSIEPAQSEAKIRRFAKNAPSQRPTCRSSIFRSEWKAPGSTPVTSRPDAQPAPAPHSRARSEQCRRAECVTATYTARAKHTRRPTSSPVDGMAHARQSDARQPDSARSNHSRRSTDASSHPATPASTRAHLPHRLDSCRWQRWESDYVHANGRGGGG